MHHDQARAVHGSRMHGQDVSDVLRRRRSLFQGPGKGLEDRLPTREHGHPSGRPILRERAGASLAYRDEQGDFLQKVEGFHVQGISLPCRLLPGRQGLRPPLRIPQTSIRPAPVPLRVLWQNRNDSDSLPGGDTTVLKESVGNLKGLGVAADVSLEDGPDLSSYQMVHLNNISRTRDTLAQARNAKRQKRPSLLTPLYEDMDRYLTPATKMDLLYQRMAVLKTRLSLDDLADRKSVV